MKYPKSIITNRLDECLICKTTRNIEVHHIFNGPYRKKSTQYGCVCGLCRDHHTGQYGVHRNAQLNIKLKQYGQRKFEEIYGHELYMKEFGKSYL